MQPLQSLQATRAIAALMVVAYHLGLITQKYFGTAAFLAPAGRAGVEYFFVLSGFIITLAHAKDVGKPERLLPYVRKRLLRIYPIYWLIFLLAFAVAFRTLELTATDVAWAMLLLPAPSAPVISVAWSLQYEMVFYAVFAGFIVHPVLGLLVATAAWALLTVLTPAYLLIFLLGVVAAIVYRRFVLSTGRSVAVAVAGLGAFVAAAWVESRTGVGSPSWYALGAFGIVLGLAQAERQGYVFGQARWLQLLGNASYAIYLVHYPLLSGVYKAAQAAGLSGPAWAPLTYTVGLVGAIATGVALHWWVERPLLQRFSTPRHKQSSPSPTMRR